MAGSRSQNARESAGSSTVRFSTDRRARQFLRAARRCHCEPRFPLQSSEALLPLAVSWSRERKLSNQGLEGFRLLLRAASQRQNFLMLVGICEPHLAIPTDPNARLWRLDPAATDALPRRHIVRHARLAWRPPNETPCRSNTASLPRSRIAPRFVDRRSLNDFDRYSRTIRRRSRDCAKVVFTMPI